MKLHYIKLNEVKLHEITSNYMKLHQVTLHEITSNYIT